MSDCEGGSDSEAEYRANVLADRRRIAAEELAYSRMSSYEKLFYLVKQHDSQKLKKFLKDPPYCGRLDVNVKDPSGRTALFYAWYRYYDVRLLIQHGAVCFDIKNPGNSSHHLIKKTWMNQLKEYVSTLSQVVNKKYTGIELIEYLVEESTSYFTLHKTYGC